MYTTDILPDDDDYYALLVLDSLLGGSSVSLLFEEVREKNSLCYSISTSLVRFSGLLLITTGAARSALPKVEELVRHILEQVKNKEVDPATFEMVKAEMIDSLKGQSDSAARMIEQEFLNQILHRTDDIGDVIESVRAVTLDDVARAAGKLKLAVTSSVMQAEAKGPQGKEQYAA
nr:insulinase family protein [Allobaculum sp. Allo2]